MGMEILIMMSLFLTKHCYADFIIQTYTQTIRKGIYRDLIGISHSLDHVWCTYIVLLIFSVFVEPISAMMIILVGLAEGIVHYHIDWLKVKYGSKDNTKPVYWAEFGYDQLMHLQTYVLMCAIIHPR
jgi:hypothetical protein